MSHRILIIILFFLNISAFSQEVITNKNTIKILKMRDFELKQNKLFFEDLNDLSQLFLQEKLVDFIDSELGGITDPFYYYRTLGDRLFKSREKKIVIWESKLQVAFSPTQYHNFVDKELYSYFLSLKEQRSSFLKQINISDYKNKEIILDYDILGFESDYLLSEEVVLKAEAAALTDAIIDILIDLPDYLAIISIILIAFSMGSITKLPKLGCLTSICIFTISIIISVIFGSINSTKMEEPIRNYYSKYYHLSDELLENQIKDNINIFYSELNNVLEKEN